MVVDRWQKEKYLERSTAALQTEMYFDKFCPDDEWLLVQPVTGDMVNEQSLEKLLGVAVLDVLRRHCGEHSDVGRAVFRCQFLHSHRRGHQMVASVSVPWPTGAASPSSRWWEYHHCRLLASKKVWFLCLRNESTVSEHLASNYFPFTNDELSKEKSKVWGGEEERNITSVEKPEEFTADRTVLPIPCLSWHFRRD